MIFGDIKKIKEVYSDVEVNKLLSKNYVLLRILQTKKVNNGTEIVRPMYILGKDKE